jgi:hypothetical protein
MAMENNQVLEEILVMVKALIKKVDEQQEKMLKKIRGAWRNLY